MNKIKSLWHKFSGKPIVEKLAWIAIALMGVWQLMERQYLLPAVLLLSAIKGNSYKQKLIIIRIIYIIITVSFLLYSILYFDYYRVAFVTYALTAVLFCIVTVSVFKGLHQKGFIILAIGIAVLIEILSLFRYVLYSGQSIIEHIGNISFYIALLIFSLKNTFHYYVSNFGNKNMSIEQELQILNDRLEIGIITEEEYQKQRRNIICRL